MRNLYILLCSLIACFTLLSAGCSSAPVAKAGDANQKRWDNFQKDNKKERAVAMDAFEKRQAQLAEKKRKEAEKSVSKPGAEATPASGTK